MTELLDENFAPLNIYIDAQKPSKIFILCDENTHEYCLPTLLGNLKTEIPYEIIEIEPGEEMKNIQTAVQIWEILADFGADRNALILNLGGGVITDMGGFVASTYKRGIRFINVPTTLLAMCDASIGGKTGIDLAFLKNIVGTFALPEKIFLYPKFLETLPFTELRSGFAEMLKHGLIANKAHWEALSALQEITPSAIAPHVATSVTIKENTVSQDFKEKNVRKTLNFGHTVGHAVESLFLQNRQPIPHGEAVALGMICEAKLSEIEGILDKSTSNGIIAVLRKFYPYLNISAFTEGELLALMQNDKKNSGNSINFSLVTAVGSCNYDYKAQKSNIINAINFYKELQNFN